MIVTKNLDDDSEELILGQQIAFLAHFRPKNLLFFTLYPYKPPFLGSDGPELMGSYLPRILR